nr:MAG TPA: hypothetical protein [Caudoviricetes sp.]
MLSSFSYLCFSKINLRSTLLSNLLNLSITLSNYLISLITYLLNSRIS